MPCLQKVQEVNVSLREARNTAKSGCETCAILVSAAEEIVQQDQDKRKLDERSPLILGEDPFIGIIDSYSSLSIEVNGSSGSFKRDYGYGKSGAFNIFTTSKLSFF